ncbi:MAG: hypothetical protein KF863_06540 [Rubrivivax sp.]|nr:hypothetical protein [Rubrivivax sp.]
MNPSRAAAPFATLALLAGGLLAVPAAAQENSPYYIGLSQTLSHDTNLLRLGKRQAAPAGFSKSDTSSTTALIAGIDQPFGRQRFYGNVSLRANRFDKNKVYDNDGYTASVGLDFSTIERISGSLSASANRGLSRFNTEEIGLLTEKNVESVESVGATVRVGVVTEYTLEVSGSHRRVDNSLDDDRVRARNFRQDTASVGLRWRPSPDLNVGLALRGSKGTYPEFRRTATGFEVDRFDRQDVDLTAYYRPSGASWFNLRLSEGKTEYDLATRRNFSGLTGTFAWNWQPTGKLLLETRYTRDTGQDSYATSFFGAPATTDYSRTSDRFTLKAEWAASAKLLFEAGLSHADRDLVRTIDNLFLPSDARGRQKSSALTLGGRWVPARWVQLGCSIESIRTNSSGTLGNDLKGESYACYGQFTLQ